MRKAKNEEMLPSSHSKNNKTLIILAVFLFVYYGLPPIYAKFPEIVANKYFLLSSNLLMPLVMIGVIYLLYKTIYITPRNFLTLPYWEISKTTIKWILAALGSNIVWTIILVVCGFEYHAPAIEEILSKGDNLTIFSICFLAVCIAPIAEELTFREVIYNEISKYSPPQYSMVITSLLFAVAHNEFWQIPGLFILGYTFQMHRNKYNNIESAIFAHTLNNFLALVLFLIAKLYAY